MVEETFLSEYIYTVLLSSYKSTQLMIEFLYNIVTGLSLICCFYCADTIPVGYQFQTKAFYLKFVLNYINVFYEYTVIGFHTI